MGTASSDEPPEQVKQTGNGHTKPSGGDTGDKVTLAETKPLKDPPPSN